MNEFKLNFIQNEEDNQIISKILDTNTYLEPSLINSYLGFNLPSFVKKINTNNLSFSNTIFIHPLTKKYLYFDYYN